MPHVIHSHVSVDSVVCELVRHDTTAWSQRSASRSNRASSASATLPTGIVDQYVQTIGVLLDLLGHLLNFGPVGNITLYPACLGCGGFAQVLFDCFIGAVDDLFGDGKDKDLGYVVLEERVRTAVADAFGSYSPDAGISKLSGVVCWQTVDTEGRNTSCNNSNLAILRWYLINRELELCPCGLLGDAAKVLGNGVANGVHDWACGTRCVALVWEE